MTKQFTKTAFMLLTALVLSSSVFAANNLRAEQFRFAAAEEPGLTANLFETSSFQTGWTSWTTMNDGRGNGVDIRWKRGGFKFEGGNYEVFWQLRNRYRESVTISYRLTFRKADGTTFTTSEVTQLDAGETNDSIGLYNIAYSLTSYQVRDIDYNEE